MPTEPSRTGSPGGRARGIVRGPHGAHPAPSVIHDYLVQLGAQGGEVFLRLAVSPQLVTQLYRQIDTNGDGQTTPQERQVWLDRYVARMQFTLDGQPVPFGVAGASPVDQRTLVVSMQHPMTVTMHVTFTLPVESTGAPPVDHHFILADNTNYVGYDEYYSSWEDAPGAITLAHDLTQPANPATFEAIVEYDPTTARASAAPTSRAPPVAQAPAQESAGGQFLSQLDSFLQNPKGNSSFALLLFVLAVGLGGLHALTPGHGKAVVAAYLVGSRGRVRDAVALGWIVTLTHTLSVVALGLILLAISNFIVPRWLQPALELGSGLLIVGLGLYLLATRLRTERATRRIRRHQVTGGTEAVTLAGPPPPPSEPAAAAVHLPSADHPHVPNPDPSTAQPGGFAGVDARVHPHPHDHGPAGHRHTMPARASFRDLLALGISGGLVPCPDALAILLLTLPVGQLGLGLALVSSFSLGLAAVLIAIGVLMVKAKGLLERLLPGQAGDNARWIQLLPIASAIIVVVLGVALMLGALLGQRWV